MAFTKFTQRQSIQQHVKTVAEFTLVKDNVRQKESSVANVPSRTTLQSPCISWQVRGLIETKKHIAVATFYIAKTTNSGNLISATTAQEIGLINLNLNKVSTTKNNNLDKILNKPGTNIPADYLPHHPTLTSSKQASMTEDYINLIACCSVPKTLTLDEVETAMDSDKTLCGSAIKLNKWHYDLVKAFKPVKDELTITSKGVVLRGTRIVLPQSLQQPCSRHCSRHPSWTEQKQSPYP
ncbi:Hypothetical predicted protein [Paramuricea clavata]|uniref:Uncharacterized protein n=1 Tax=Paramuricea clavata TaxID=317549 RepID=A0A7D9I478_PARCT|nr:Hypothetical predicted protein [Paramuricea clavata]